MKRQVLAGAHIPTLPRAAFSAAACRSGCLKPHVLHLTPVSDCTPPMPDSVPYSRSVLAPRPELALSDLPSESFMACAHPAIHTLRLLGLGNILDASGRQGGVQMQKDLENQLDTAIHLLRVHRWVVSCGTCHVTCQCFDGCTGHSCNAPMKWRSVKTCVWVCCVWGRIGCESCSPGLTYVPWPVLVTCQIAARSTYHLLCLRSLYTAC